MAKVLFKISKVIVLGMLLMSSSSKEFNGNTTLQNETYLFGTPGVFYKESKVVVEFETIEKKSLIGDVTSVLKLYMRNGIGDTPFKMEFLIAKENVPNGIGEGNYVVNSIDGFLSHFDGVFGVVNLEMVEEKPFFAKNGNIRITALDNNNIKGKINMQFSNEYGKTIEVYGAFETE